MSMFHLQSNIEPWACSRFHRPCRPVNPSPVFSPYSYPPLALVIISWVSTLLYQVRPAQFCYASLAIRRSSIAHAPSFLQSVHLNEECRKAAKIRSYCRAAHIVSETTLATDITYIPPTIQSDPSSMARTTVLTRSFPGRVSLATHCLPPPPPLPQLSISSLLHY